MRNLFRIILLLFTYILPCVSYAQTIMSEQLRAIGLPLIEITTVDGEEPSCDYVEHPEGATGSSITNATKVPGRCVIWLGENCLYDSGDYLKGESGITIKIRGNTSAYSDKKPYKMKLQKKADLLSRNDPAFMDKDWLLLKCQKAFGNVNDMNLNMLIGNKLNQMVGMTWTPQFTHVNLIINGDYRGVYLLSESIKRSEGRVNVNKDGGFIIEHDTYWWNEPVWFETSWGGKYTFKYPEDDEITNEQIDYVKGVVKAAEDAIWANNISEVWNINTLAAWLLAHDILGSSDGGGTNMYLTKYDSTPTSKLSMGPLWDFDGIMNTEGSWSACRYYASVYYHLLVKRQPFMDAYYALWDSIKSDILTQLDNYLSSFAESEEGKALDRAREYDQQRWGTEYVPVQQNVEEAMKWFVSRTAWIQAEIDKERNPTGVNELYKLRHNGVMYDLYGKQIFSTSSQQKGFFIFNGKKVIK